jgi:hypothetical protein
VRPVLVVGLLLGAPAGLGELPLMTTRTFWQKRYRYDESAALRYLRDELPEGSVVQAGPVDERVHLPQMIHRQMGVLDPLDPHVIVLRPIDATQAAATFRRWGITHVLVGPVERARFGELPQLRDTCCFEPVFEEPHATVYRVK